MPTHAAVVLAAGQGTRMNSRISKVLHRICGREIVALVVDSARAAGLDPIVVVIPPDGDAIRDALGAGVTYVVQPEPRGSGDALLHARPFLSDDGSVVVLYGDVPLVRPETIRRMVTRHREAEASVTLLTATPARPDGLGRVVRSPSGEVRAIVEEKEADEAVRQIREINGGTYCFNSAWLWGSIGDLANSHQGETFLTDLVGLASGRGLTIEATQPEGVSETLGVNTRVELAEAESILRRRILQRWMLEGVTIRDPDSAYLDVTVCLGQDTVVLPNTHVTEGSRVGRDCEVGPNTIVRDSVVGDGCKIVASVVEGSTLEAHVDVGPFSHIRAGSLLERGVYVGNYAEVKNSRLGRGTKSGHFSYLGDAEVGANVNIGAGTVTCNYDGQRKNKTVIGDDAFIGSDSMLIAPVSIGARSATGAGAVVTKDVPSDSTAVGAPARVRPRPGSRHDKKKE